MKRMAWGRLLTFAFAALSMGATQAPKPDD